MDEPPVLRVEKEHPNNETNSSKEILVSDERKYLDDWFHVFSLKILL
jgi:hypothetical protein